MAVRTKPTLLIEWTPDPIVFGRALMEVDAGLRNTYIPMRWAAEEMSADIKERFETQTDPSGAPWEEWSDSYAAVAEAFPNIAILRRTDALYDAVTSDEAMIVNNNTVFFDESQMPRRGFWHQIGIPNRKTKSGAPNPLPERRFLGLTTTTRAYIIGMWDAWFDETIQLYTTTLNRLGRRHAAQGVHPVSGRRGFIPRSSPMIKLPPHRRG